MAVATAQLKTIYIVATKVGLCCIVVVEFSISTYGCITNAYCIIVPTLRTTTVNTVFTAAL